MNIAERVKERRTHSNADSLVFTDNKKSKGNLTSRFLRCRNETDESDSEESFEESLRRFSPVIDDIESGSDEIPAVYVLVPSRPRTNYVRSKSLSPKCPRTYSVQSQSLSSKRPRTKSVQSLPSSSNLQGKLLSMSNSLDKSGVYERYFEENANPSSTSGNTLSDPNMLNKVEYFDVMGNIPVKHKREIESLHQRH
ncbi:17534_t:CDS:1, partial [Acaulospora morrowiae]